MGKKFWLTWLGLVWLSSCGGDSTLGSGRDSESKLSTKDKAAAEQAEDSSDSTPDEQDSGVDAPGLSEGDDDMTASGGGMGSPDDDDTGVGGGMGSPDDDDMIASGGERGSPDGVGGGMGSPDDDDMITNGGGNTRAGAGGGPSMIGTNGGASPQGMAGASSTGGAGTPNLGPDPAELEPYEPRDGSFRMLAYSKTAGFRHDSSIITGQVLLQKIADEWEFDVVFTETNEDFTVEGLSQYELVFFLNTSGDVLNNGEQAAYETWLTEHNGAFAGTHSATDTENGWAFYSEVTGQYYSGHGASGAADSIQFDATQLGHPALAGLPNPWPRNEEWFRFDDYLAWSTKPGFAILGQRGDGQPVMWTREWGNFRSFYTAIGHEGAVFDGDADVEKHITGGVLWAVRREHWLE